jgi:hypothetical protein
LAPAAILPRRKAMDMRQDLRHLELLKTWPWRRNRRARRAVWPGALIAAARGRC